ncbi:YqeG family HAD IIIA-type phosphatase [Oscillospiraceae bacterium MB08-C2-2]|nr:YqeG family HAD IIIA-type phosphatase [Oscillospiraceae bacterium MB08-C2-2]
MSVFYPTVLQKRVYCIDKPLLERLGVTALILDVDNTLTTHDNPVPHERVLDWLREMKEQGIGLIILSNNNPERVRPFADMLGLPFAANAAKPLPGGYRKAIQRLGVPSHQTAVVGDQIFTDVLGGNLAGIKTILVEPMEFEDKGFFRLKRRVEKGILRRYRKGRKQRG